MIMDFGIARRDEAVEARLTKTGAILGTPAFMAPEQIEGNPDAVGRACDIYSLGVIFYELLTAHLPFSGSVMAMLGKILHQPPEPPSKHRPDLDRSLEAVCLKAMAKRPQDRYPSMADLVSALEEYLRRVPGTETLVTPNRAWAKAAPGSLPRPWTRRRRLLVGGAICLASALAGFVVYEGYKLTSIPTPTRSESPRPDERETRSAAATDRKSLPGSTSSSSPSLISGARESAPPAGKDARTHTQAKPPAGPVPVPKQAVPRAPATPPSQLAATPPAPTPRTSRPRSGEPPRTITDSIGIKLVLIPSGTFRMGSAEGEGETDEHPSHEVRISRPFYMGIHEVTQGQY